jgi:hypothetical protein
MARYIIFGLAAIAVWTLFRGLKHELAAPDPRQPPTYNTILLTIHERNLACDEVKSFHPIGKQKGWDFYLAECGKGGRFIYAQSAAEGKVFAYSCQEGAQRGYYCPQD